MNKKTLYLVVILSGLGFCLLGTPTSTKASPRLFTTSTPSPTITTEPLIIFETPTSMPVLSAECPEDGVIEGWLTVTPSALWLSYCAHCVVTPLWTSTAQPTPTWDGTGTPDATATPDATETPSPSSPTPANDGYYLEYCTSSIDWVGNGCASPVDNTVCVLSIDNRQCACEVEAFIDDVGGGGTSSCRLHVNVRARRSDWYSAASSLRWYDNVVPSHGFSSFSFWTRTNGEFYTHEGAIDASRVYEFHFATYSSAEAMGEMSLVGQAVIGLDDIVMSTPTPIATPTQSDLYCDTVHGDVPENSPFWYSGIEFGAMYCIDLLPYEKSILGVDLVIPHFAHICVQNVSLGQGKIFGMLIDLDVALFVAGVAWAIRNLFIS